MMTTVMTIKMTRMAPTAPPTVDAIESIADPVTPEDEMVVVPSVVFITGTAFVIKRNKNEIRIVYIPSRKLSNLDQFANNYVSIQPLYGKKSIPPPIRKKICVLLIGTLKINNFPIFNQNLLKHSLTRCSHFSASIKTNSISG